MWTDRLTNTPHTVLVLLKVNSVTATKAADTTDEALRTK